MSPKNHKPNYEFKMELRTELVKTFIGKNKIVDIMKKYRVDIKLIRPDNDDSQYWTLLVSGKKLRVKSAENDLIERYNKMVKVIENLIKKYNDDQFSGCSDPVCAGCNECVESSDVTLENKIISHK